MAKRSRSIRAAVASLAGTWVSLGLAGCALVPRTRLDDAQKVVQGLRTENAQLKDSTLRLKIQNQDLTQRAVDDSQAIRALEAANTQYERSIEGYQDDRERMRSAFNELKDRFRSATVR